MFKCRKVISILIFIVTLMSCKNSDTDVKAITRSSVPYKPDVASLNDFEVLSRTQAGGTFVKYSYFFKELSGTPKTSSVFFQNTAVYSSHVEFFTAHKILPTELIADYEKLLLGSDNQGNEKIINGGSLYINARKEIGITLYVRPETWEQDKLDKYILDSIKNTYDTIVNKVKFTSNIYFIIEDESAYKKHKDTLGAFVKVAPFSQFIDMNAMSQTYNAATSYGYLKVISAEQMEKGEYSPKDILIINKVPLDISPVSGIITETIQSPHSHVILRSINLNIPDMFVSNAKNETDIKRILAKGQGQLIKFSSLNSGEYVIQDIESIPNIKSEAEKYWENRKKAVSEPKFDLTVQSLYLLKGDEQPNFDIVKIYGAKGTNFAIANHVLAKNDVGYREEYENSFLIPFSFYHQHILSSLLSVELCQKVLDKCKKDYDVNACNSNAQQCTSLVNHSIKDYIAKWDNKYLKSMVDNASQRQASLYFLRQLISRSSINPTNLQTITAAILKATQGKNNIRFRLRSSTNAEDIPGLNGAGLYESKAACLADDKILNEKNLPSACRTDLELQRIKKEINRLSKLPQSNELKDYIKDLTEQLTNKYPLSEAIAKVYASLWNEKSFLTREFYGIDHSKIFMGILAHPSFSDENANGVAIVEFSGQHYGDMQASIVTQIEDISITNPVTNDIAEEVVGTATNNSISTLTQSQKSSLGQRVLTDATYRDLMRQSYLVGQEMLKIHSPAEYGLRYDIEFKVNIKNQVIFKQIRPLLKNESDSSDFNIDEVIATLPSEVKNYKCSGGFGASSAALNIFSAQQAVIVVVECRNMITTPGGYFMSQKPILGFYDASSNIPNDSRAKWIVYKDAEYKQRYKLYSTHHNGCDSFDFNFLVNSTPKARYIGAWGPRGRPPVPCQAQAKGAPKMITNASEKKMNIEY